MHLLADIGGTRTRLGLADARGLIDGTARSLANAEFDSPEALIAAYLDARRPGPLRAVCAGVAGPVRDGAAQLTNHPWQITTAALQAATGAGTVHLLNDLQAQAYALDDLPASALTPIRPGQAQPDGPRLVLGLGTGCNVAVAHRIGPALFVPASEAGHTRVPHLDPEGNALTDHLARTHPHTPIEAALSGPGLTRVHRWLGGTAPDAAQVVAAHATGSDPRATEALTLFCRLLGAVAGDLCLHHMATGGLYLTGGAARAIAPHLIGCGFAPAFTGHGPYSGLLAAIPVTLIADDTAALRGCARYLAQCLK